MNYGLQTHKHQRQFNFRNFFFSFVELRAQKSLKPNASISHQFAVASLRNRKLYYREVPSVPIVFSRETAVKGNAMLMRKTEKHKLLGSAVVL